MKRILKALLIMLWLALTCGFGGLALTILITLVWSGGNPAHEPPTGPLFRVCATGIFVLIAGNRLWRGPGP